WFLWSCYALVSRAKKGLYGTSLRAMKVFHGSITYLSLLFLAVAVDPFVTPLLPSLW
ncbi:protoheme IX farnesyltransferase, partial [Burkholderia multivorans]